MTMKEAAATKAKAKGRTWQDVFSKLPHENHRDAVSSVLHQQRSAETNRYAHWNYVVILTQHKNIRGSLGYLSEIVSITVVLRRELKHEASLDTSLKAKYGAAMNTNGAYFPLEQTRVPIAAHQVQTPRTMQQTSSVRPLPPQAPANLQNMRQDQVMPNNYNMDRTDLNRGQQGLTIAQARPLQNGPPNIHQRAQFDSRAPRVDPNRASMDTVDKIDNWRKTQGGFAETRSESSDDSDSEDEEPIRVVPQVNRKPQATMPPMPPKPPMPQAPQQPQAYASVGNGRQSRPVSPSPILKKKTSTSEFMTNRNGEQHRVDKEVIENFPPRRNSSDSGGGSSDGSYVHVNNYSKSSRTNSTRGTVYSDVSSENGLSRHKNNYESSHKDQRQQKDRRRSQSREPRSQERRIGQIRDHRGDPFDRDDAQYDRNSPKQQRYRQHRLPSPFRNLMQAQDSDEDRSPQPIIVHNHIHQAGPTSGSVSPLGSSTASLWGTSYPERRRTTQYPESRALYNINRLEDTSLPAAPMVPSDASNSAMPMAVGYTRSQALKERERYKSQAAENYMREEEFNARLIEAFNRGAGIRHKRDSDANNVLWSDPVERQNRKEAIRGWDDWDWDHVGTESSIPQPSWKLTDDLIPNYSTGYGTTSSKRNSSSDGQYDPLRYGERSYSMRAPRDTMFV
jgi:hypothetical protein